MNPAIQLGTWVISAAPSFNVNIFGNYTGAPLVPWICLVIVDIPTVNQIQL